METFITVIEHGKIYKRPMPTKRLIAFNGFSVFIHGNAGDWNATELTTGMSVAHNFKTLKALEIELNTIAETMNVPMFINRQMDYIKNNGGWEVKQ